MLNGLGDRLRRELTSLIPSKLKLDITEWEVYSVLSLLIEFTRLDAKFVKLMSSADYFVDNNNIIFH